MTDYETAYRALREGLEALHVRDGVFCRACSVTTGRTSTTLTSITTAGEMWPCRTIALLASSPAEGTGEAIHDDGCAEWCNHCEVCGIGTPYGSRCPSHPNAPAPVSSGEAGRDYYWPGTFGPAPVVTPSAEDGA